MADGLVVGITVVDVAGVNRNVIGAMVGVQPFGGMGLSGTGPKAGGPLYLHRLAQGPASAALSVFARAESSPQAPLQLLGLLRETLSRTPPNGLSTEEQVQALAACDAAAAASRLDAAMLLPGPTGESNRYRLLPRGPVWALPRTPLGLVAQVAAALASGNPCHAVLPDDGGCTATWQALRAAAGDAGVHWLHAASADTLADGAAPMAALLFEGDGDALLQVCAQIAARDGALVRVESRNSDELHAGRGYDLAALFHEQSISTNTAAAGGNAQLMTMA
jgi:RHH-type proline utilization regulon transcriptional repressor/proline dehydrogenase/delta 1-pyrroline-5-carboxylate dehydrogenase